MRSRPDPVALLVLPALLYLGIVYAVPLAGLLVGSVVRPGGVTLAPFAEFFRDLGEPELGALLICAADFDIVAVGEGAVEALDLAVGLWPVGPGLLDGDAEFGAGVSPQV